MITKTKTKLVKKGTPKSNKHNLGVLYILAFILSLSTALPAYIQSNFLKQFVNLNTLSLFFILANAATFLAIIFFPNLIKKLSNYYLTKITLVVYASSLLGLTIANSPAAALINIIIYTVSLDLLWINMDVLVESFSANATTGRTRTYYFTCINLGWIFSPLLSAYLISIGEYALTFFVAAALVIPVFIIFYYQGKNLKDKIKYSKDKLAVVIKKMWQNCF